MENQVFTFISLVQFKDELKASPVNSSHKNEVLNRLSEAIGYVGMSVLESVEDAMLTEKALNKVHESINKGGGANEKA